MTSSMQPIALLLVTGLIALTTAPARAEFAAELRAALDIHDRASSLEEQAEALDAFQKTAARYPDRWRAHFWTAYEETQIAMLRKRQEPEADLDDYLVRAQHHLSKAEELHKAASERERSSFAALQGLIYRFRAWFDETEAESWRERSSRAIQRAAAIDPNNPVVLVMISTELVRRGRQDEDYSLLLAASHLMRRGQEAAATISDRSQTTFFNSEWIQFWLPSAEKTLAELNPPG